MTSNTKDSNIIHTNPASKKTGTQRKTRRVQVRNITPDNPFETRCIANRYNINLAECISTNLEHRRVCLRCLQKVFQSDSLYYPEEVSRDDDYTSQFSF